MLTEKVKIYCSDSSGNNGSSGNSGSSGSGGSGGSSANSKKEEKRSIHTTNFPAIFSSFFLSLSSFSSSSVLQFSSSVLLGNSAPFGDKKKKKKGKEERIHQKEWRTKRFEIFFYLFLQKSRRSLSKKNPIILPKMITIMI